VSDELTPDLLEDIRRALTSRLPEVTWRIEHVDDGRVEPPAEDSELHQRRHGAGGVTGDAAQGTVCRSCQACVAICRLSRLSTPPRSWPVSSRMRLSR
jgi:ferredoxin